MENKRCLLSVAMIVKDEEHNIRRALESIKDIVDEIIVVDTGSTDKTPEIVKEYTDKLYFHEWKDDFSEARNYSLKFPTCEWVMIFDADEEVKEDFKGIREFLENLPNDVNTVYLPTLSYLDWDLKKTETASVPRIFRNGTVKYKNIVHNQPEFKGKVVNAPFTIYHYGYIWTRNLREKKYNRTRNLILKHLENKNLEPLERIYYLVQLYKIETLSKYKNRKNEVGWETLKEINKIKKIPAIGMEFLFLFGLDALNKNMLDLSMQLFNKAIQAVPKYPDPYFGLIGIYEKQDDIENQHKYAKLFLEKLEYAQKHPEEFEWTIVGFKFKGAAYATLVKYYLNKNDIKNFEIYLNKLLNVVNSTGENIKKLLSIITNEIEKIQDVQILKKLKPSIELILTYLNKYNIKINIWKIIYKFLDNKIYLSPELIEKFAETDFQKYVIAKLNLNEDYLIPFIFKNDYENNIKTLNDILFLFKYYNESKKELLKIFVNLRKNFDNEIQGIIYTLIGDIYLRLSNLPAAISSYRKAIELNKDLGFFIKPILDDLKTKLDTNIDGTFEEIVKYFGKVKEFLFEPDNLDKEELEYLNLISDSDYAKYVAAINSKENDRRLKLLKEIKNINDFPFYYYRIAKIYEENKDYDKAFYYHIKACKENPKIGDLTFGIYEYDGFYPNTSPSFINKNDETIWCKNISEKTSGFGIINPIRMWKKSKEFYYALPYPNDEALKISKQQRKKLIKDWPFEIDKDFIFQILVELNEKEINFLDEFDEIPTSILKELDIINSKYSQTIFSLYKLHTKPFISKIIPNNTKKGILMYFTPDLEDSNDIVWFNPEFRILRTTSQIKKSLEKLNLKIIKIIGKKKIRAILFEKV